MQFYNPSKIKASENSGFPKNVFRESHYVKGHCYFSQKGKITFPTSPFFCPFSLIFSGSCFALETSQR